MLRRTALLCPLVALTQAARSAPLSATASAPAFAAPPPPQPRGVSRRPLSFPADFGAHPDTRTEWWYVTGSLQPDGASGGPQFGFQVTFFRSRTDVAPDHPSRFAASQLVFAHAALSDIKARRLRHDQRVARAGFGIAEAATADTALQLRGWQLLRSGPATASAYRARLASDTAGFELDLGLTTTQPLLLQGDAGYSRKGPAEGEASHYYSQPQLAVQGRLTLDGRPVPVTGRAWLDHEWSNTLLAADAVGWDWIGMNLADGGALTAFRLRRADGSAVYGGGSFRSLGGTTKSFGPDEVVFTPGRRWVSPHSKASYPVNWTVATPIGRFQIDAAFDDQELDSRRSTGAVYWEGLSSLSDAAGRLVGTGYLEMTGYAARLQL